MLNPKAINLVVRDMTQESMIYLIEDAYNRIDSNPENRAYVREQKTLIDALQRELRKRWAKQEQEMTSEKD